MLTKLAFERPTLANRRTLYFSKRFQGEFAAGTKSYTKALNLLRNGEKTIQKAFLYQRLGYNLYCRGKYAESIKYV